eukprot:269620-Alexandrium_andersonii.AAC.1
MLAAACTRALETAGVSEGWAGRGAGEASRRPRNTRKGFLKGNLDARNCACALETGRVSEGWGG